VGLLQGEPDGLDVRAYAHDFMGRGSFVVTVRLTKREIANLARIAFAEDRLSDVINALSKSERGVRLPKRPIPVAR
jgi:hypothetical protein